MYKTIFNTEENQNNLIEKDILSIFRKEKNKNSQINQSMSPEEIADIVSEHLLSIIKEQFEMASKEYKSKIN